MKRQISKTTTALLISSLLPLSSVQAAEVKYNFAGFASFAYAKALDNAEVTGDPFPGLHTGEITEDGDYRRFSNLGLRLDAQINEKLSFTSQMAVKGANDFDPQFDWLYASYKIAPNLEIMVGRTTLPTFIYSDFFDTSYAYPWVRPPFTVYGVGGDLEQIDGLRLQWRQNLTDSWELLSNIWSGKSEGKTDKALQNSDISVNANYGISLELSNEWFTSRVVASQSNATLDENFNDIVVNGYKVGGVVVRPGLFDQNALKAELNAVGITTPADQNKIDQASIRNDLLWKNDDSRYYGLGLSADFDTVFFIAEGSRQQSVDTQFAFSDKNDSWFLAAGTRLPGEVTLTLSYGEDRSSLDDNIIKTFDKDLQTLYPSLNAAQRKQVTNVLETRMLPLQKKRASEYMLTSRWDFHKQAALKFEYIYVEVKRGNRQKRKPDAIRLSIDVIF